PPRISAAAHSELTKLGVRVLTQTMVTSADEGGLHTKDGEYIEADLMVWAAGIKAPDFLKDIGGLETNRINQLVVEPTRLVRTIEENAIHFDTRRIEIVR
ncbi:FAD-dependent oxidoreductase, partial [Escherichia coli]|uniref:FAD-dependent oxidoreductase n=1 Tax=Escherichia coli TaxID=562 RepID=UPI00201B15C9